MSTEQLDKRIARLAAANHGVFSRTLAIRAGATPGMIRARLGSGRWVSMQRGVYRVAGAPASWEQQVLAACLACGPTAVASHTSAGTLWGFPGITSDALEVSVPLGRRPRPAGVVVHQTQLGRADVARVGAIPITRPARTLIDLAACVHMNTLEEVLDDALRRKLVTVASMTRRIRQAGRRQGLHVLHALVAARDPDEAPPQSPLETRVLRVIRRGGLPRPVRQFMVTDGRRRAFLDVAWPELRLAVEVDGYRHHSGRARWEGDRARQNMLTLLGWRIIHVTAADLERPFDVVERIAAALAS